MRVLVAVAACLGAVACTASEGGDVTDRPHAILLVTLSSTRADRLGPYGFPRPRTATLDALAATGTTWLRAYSATPETLSSHTTLMTGTYPPTHGVRDGTRADPLVPTLAERLATEGWQTAAFTGAMSTHRHLGVMRGFEVVIDRLGRPPASLDWPRQRSAEHVVTEAARFLETADLSEPTLVWVHLYDPHWPHQPPDAWLEDVGDPYEAEIAYTDWELGRLLRAWDAVVGPHGGWVMVTADHGTGLGEGGEQTQGYLLHDATLHVPLIARGPGITAGHRDDSLVSHIDVVPTLLDLAGLPDAPEVQGRDLRYGGSDGAYHEAMLGQYTLGLAPLRAVTVEDGRVTEGTWVGWYPSLGTWTGPDAERLEPDDPRIERVRAMRASLGTGRVASRPMDRQTTSMLAGLGYATTGDPDAGAGPVDPRDVGDALPLLFRARERLAGGLLHQADALQAELVQRLPASHGLTALDADIDHRRGRLDRARATWEARHHEVATPASAMRVAELAAAMGNFDAAAAWYDSVLVDQPEAPEALAGLARAAWMLGEDDRAESTATRMLVVAPDDPQTAAVHAESLLRGGQLDAALDEARAAHDAMPWSPWPSHVVGGVLWERGLGEQAVDELRRAVEKDPWQAAVRLRLADFLLEMGRNHEAVRALAPLAAAAPNEPRIQGAYEAARMAMTMDEKHDIRRQRALGPSGRGW